MTTNELKLIFASWAIPAALTWILSKTAWLKERPYILSSLISAAVAVGVSYSILVFNNPLKGTVYFAPQAGACPEAYKDMSTIILIRYKDAQDLYINAPDVQKRGQYQGMTDWFNDLTKLCVHK